MKIKDKCAGLKYIHVYTDGSCGPANPGNMGLGITYYDDNSYQIASLSLHAGEGTNNRAELLAAIIGLMAIEGVDESTSVTLHTDSNYVVQGMKSWIKKWIKERRLGLGTKTVKNVDLWRALYNVSKSFKNLKFKWVRGHNGHPANEATDSLAKEGYLKTDPDAIQFDIASVFNPRLTKLSKLHVYENKNLNLSRTNTLRLPFPKKDEEENE